MAGLDDQPAEPDRSGLACRSEAGTRLRSLRLPDIPLSDHYRAYIDCLNRQDWPTLECFVDDAVKHNGRAFGISGYRNMLIKDFQDIPDLRFSIDLLVCDPPYVAARLMFE